MTSIRQIIPLCVALLLVFTACEVDDEVNDLPDEQETADARVAVAQLEPKEGHEASGQVTFTEEGDGVRVVANIEGLPNTRHGFHIHEHGDCSADDSESAGGHFNPADTPHGGPDDPADERHVGDLGNLEADMNGVAHYDRLDEVLSFDGDESILDRSVIVHLEEDDLETDPTGDAGDRIACGVIRRGD